jgi:DNA-binding NarL/FixJ family response regulator
MPHVLMIGEYDGTLESYRAMLQRNGYQVAAAAQGREGLALARQQLVDVILTNLECSDMTADELLQRLHAAHGQPPIVVTRRRPRRDTVEPRPVEYVEPSRVDTELVAALERALTRPRAAAQPPQPQPAPPAMRVEAVPARLMVIAENRLVREALQAALAKADRIEVVATGDSADDLSLPMVQDCRPDALLMDIGPHPETTAAHLRELATTCPETRVIIMDVAEAVPALLELLEAGAAGFVLKRATVDEIVQTTRAALAGATVLPRSLVGELFSCVAERASQIEREDWRDLERITRREHEIIGLIADGLSNKEIASRLNIATFTVKSHVHNILEKLALRTRAQVARYFVLRRSQGGAALPLPLEDDLHAPPRRVHAAGGVAR